MSVDILVVLALNQAPSGESWAHALAETKGPVAFVQPIDTLHASGFVPMSVNGRSTGLYFLRRPYAEAATLYAPISSVHLASPVVYVLSFGAHSDECTAVFMSASVLVAKFNGIAFDPQSGTVVTAKQLRNAADQCSLLSPR